MAIVIPSIFLIGVGLLVPIVLLVACFVFIVYFSSPDDKNQAWIPKIITLLGLTLACCSILLLPFDVANRSFDGHLDQVIAILWQVVYVAVAVYVTAIIPFAYFYYEAYDPSKDWKRGILNQLLWATIFSAVTIFVSVVAVVILYIFLGKADIPYKRYTSQLATTRAELELDNYSMTVQDDIISVRVSIVIYLVAVFSFVGWIFFVIFGGCGLTALPMDLVLGFWYRPRRISAKDYATVKVQLKERSEQLIMIGHEIEERQKSGKGMRKTRKLYNAFKQAVYSLEEDFQKLETAYRDAGGSPIKHFFKLVFGFFFAIMAVIWLIHIVIYMVIPFNFFPWGLSWIFAMLDSIPGVGPGIGTIFYGLFAFHLLFAVVAGQIKIGSRILFISIHPLKPGDTLMNSFLWNVGLMLLCSITITQFCASAFATYARETAIDAFFRTFIRNLKYVRYFWIFYPHAFVLFSIFAAIMCFVFFKRPNRERLLVEALKEAEAEESAKPDNAA